MAYSESRKNTVLQKYHMKLLHTLSECIEDILPDLESAGAIIGDQRDKVREYVHGKMPANAIDYLLNDHIKAPLSVERSNAFMKLLEVMKKAPTRCSTQCKALAKTVEKELTNEMSSEMDETTRWMQSLGNTGGQVIEGRIRRWKAWRTNTAESGKCSLLHGNIHHDPRECHKHRGCKWICDRGQSLDLLKFCFDQCLFE